jgi:hypothetical protein
MLRASDFRRIVLGMEGAFEGAHMGHPDFRAHGRIFATLNAEETRGVVMLTPEQQQTFLADHSAMFEAGPGAWGRSGSTWVNLDAADEDAIGEAVTLAWQNAAAKAAARSAGKAGARKKPPARASEKAAPTARRKTTASSRKQSARRTRKKPRR